MIEWYKFGESEVTFVKVVTDFISVITASQNRDVNGESAGQATWLPIV